VLLQDLTPYMCDPVHVHTRPDPVHAASMPQYTTALPLKSDSVLCPRDPYTIGADRVMKESQ